MRPEVQKAAVPSKPAMEHTIMEAAQWYAGALSFVPFQPDEASLVNEQFIHMVTSLAEREGVKPGGMAYLVDAEAALLRQKEEALS